MLKILLFILTKRSLYPNKRRKTTRYRYCYLVGHSEKKWQKQSESQEPPYSLLNLPPTASQVPKSDNHSKGVLPWCCTSTLRILPAENDFPEVLRSKRNPGVMVMRSLIRAKHRKEQIRTQLSLLSNSQSTRHRSYARVMLAPGWQIIADLKLNSFICSAEDSQTNSKLV